jgi:hypothetical protein
MCIRGEIKRENVTAKHHDRHSPQPQHTDETVEEGIFNFCSRFAFKLSGRN